MENSLPEIPIVASLVATIIRRFRFSEEADLAEFFNIIKENLEKISKNNKNCIMRIMFFLDKVYEIRLIKYNEYIYILTNFRKTRNKELFEIMIELYSISKYAMNYYMQEFKEIEKFSANSIDEIIMFLKNILIKNLINIKFKEYNKNIKTISQQNMKAYRLQETSLSPQNKQIIFQKSIFLDKKIINNIIRKIIYTDYNEENIINIINNYGVAAIGSGSRYVMIYKKDDEKCKYIIILYNNANYEIYCAKEIDNIIRKYTKEMLVA